MRAAKALEVVSDVETVLVVQYAIDLSENGILVEAARERACRRCNLRRQGGIVGQEIRILCKRIIQLGAVIPRQRLIADLPFIITQVKKPVMNQRPANRSSELLSPVMRFSDPGSLVDFIVGIGGGIQNVVVAVAVNLVGAALGDGVYHPTAGLAKFGLKTGTRHLEFADHVLAELIRNTGAPNLLREESVVVVSAIHRVVVEVPGNTVKADHPEVAIGRRSRGQQGEIGEVSSVRRKRLYAALVHDRAERGRCGINQRNLGTHVDWGVDLPESEWRM